MKVAAALFCVGAVGFLLRVLAAFVKEALRPPHQRGVYFAKSYPSKLGLWKFVPRERGELIVMSSNAPRNKFPFRRGQRIALLLLAAVGLLHRLG
ncbi:MAG TPA: hypothetical protein VMD99_05870 [Terriglobales bacterium]|nr:hypothetical protein [Terriglobales bacterium]